MALAGCIAASCAGASGPGVAAPAFDLELDDPTGRNVAGVAVADHPRTTTALLALDEDMRRFVREIRLIRRSNAGKVDALLDALYHTRGVRVHYRTGSTYSAAETFRRRRGDCLSVTALFIALAREMGLRAGFQDVIIQPVWRRGDHLFVHERHVSALVKLNGRDSVTVDFDTRTSVRSPRTHHTVEISDRTALALYYNNLAATALDDGDLAGSYHLFRRAVAADARLSYVWSNVGSLYRTMGRHERAEAAYLHALTLQPREFSAMANLVNLYRRTGRPEMARRYVEQVERYRRDNPYYMHALAQDAARRGDYARAERYLRRAIELASNEESFRVMLREIQSRTRHRRSK